ncbi:MAG: PHP domain-containing protein [Nitrospirae bacterium]|nr:PHP domain-containing protein [Nitrospirota bacterium]
MNSRLLKVDMHVHTHPFSPCSTTTPHEAIEAAINAGMDVLVFTDHDTIWLGQEIDELQQWAGGQLRLLAGIEVSCLEGHFLVYGLDKVDGLRYNMPVKELIGIARRREAAVIAAHPFRFSMECGNNCYQLDIDAVEVDSSNTSQTAQALAVKLATQRNLPRIYASDAHCPRDVGSYHTLLSGPIDTIADLVREIKNAKRGYVIPK